MGGQVDDKLAVVPFWRLREFRWWETYGERRGPAAWNTGAWWW
jgi:hypothetical protein